MATGDGPMTDPLVLVLDIGTTASRAYVYNKYASILSKSSVKALARNTEQGMYEIDPDLLWLQVQEVIRTALAAANITAKSITCMGITVQRNTFITWDRETGKPFHNFLSWQDMRAAEYVKKWNSSYTMKTLSCCSSLIHLITGIRRMHAASTFKFMSSQVTLRLLWQLEHVPELRRRAAEGQAMFGTMETWLLWKLTGHREFATDYSCASATAMYDLFKQEWCGFLLKGLGIPMSMLPPVQDTSGLFGECAVELFGAAIPITALVGDQSSSLFGQCCFEVGDFKCTMGGGMFVNCNSGKQPITSFIGTYPQIGWKIGDELTYVVEGLAGDCGACIAWAKSVGYFDDLSELTSIANSVPNSGGVYFVPAFTGLQAPINDEAACACFIGIQHSTTRAHMVRAILESLAFRLVLLVESIEKESQTELKKLCKCDGGVSGNEFIMQLVSDLTGREIITSGCTDKTSLGAAFLAGLHMGVWENRQQLCELTNNGSRYRPRESVRNEYKVIMAEWKRAISRSKNWYK